MLYTANGNNRLVSYTLNSRRKFSQANESTTSSYSEEINWSLTFALVIMVLTCKNLCTRDVDILPLATWSFYQCNRLFNQREHVLYWYYDCSFYCDDRFRIYYRYYFIFFSSLWHWRRGMNEMKNIIMLLHLLHCEVIHSYSYLF